NRAVAAAAAMPVASAKCGTYRSIPTASSSSQIPWTPCVLLHGDRALPDVRSPSALITFAPEAEIYACSSYAETVKRNLRQPMRELRRDVEPSGWGIGPDAENRLQ